MPNFAEIVQGKQKRDFPTYNLEPEPEPKTKGAFESIVAGKTKSPDPTGRREEISSYDPSMWERVGNMFSDPAKEASKAVLAIVDAEMNEITPSQAMYLRNQIDKGVKLNPAKAKLRGDGVKIFNQNLNNAYAHINLGLAGFEVLMGDNSEKIWDTINKTKAAMTKDEEIPYPVNIFQEIAGSTGMLVPYFAENARRGAWRGMILAGGVGLMGAATGTLAITYPLMSAMYGVGHTSASLELIGKVEGGAFFIGMLDYIDPKTGEKVNPNIARALAFGVLAINSLIELAQFKTLVNSFPGGKKLLRGLINETVKDVVESGALRDILGRAGGIYGKTIVKEAAQETAQESVTITAEVFAKKLTNHLDGTDLSIQEKEKIFDRLTQTFRQSIQGFAVLGSLGPSVSVARGVRQSRIQQEEAQARGDRAQKVFKATAFSQLRRAQEDEAVEEFEPTPEEVQKYIDNPAESSITDEQLDQIIGDEANEERLIGDILDQAGFTVVGDEDAPAQIGPGDISPIFYSAVEKGVSEFKQETASASQWLGMINKLPIKKEELEWIGLEDWLKEQDGKVSKQDILDFVQANNVRVEEVVKGGTPIYEDIDSEIEQRASELFDEAIEKRLVELGEEGEFLDKSEIEDDFDYADFTLQAHNELIEETETETKFQEFQLPGGENYKELLIFLPVTSPVKKYTKEDFSIFEDSPGKYKIRMPDGALYRDGEWTRRHKVQAFDRVLDLVRELNSEEKGKTQYTSTHFPDTLNILANVRFNERTDTEGNRVLFIEEVQSDWHQEGRKKGYTERYKPDDVVPVTEEEESAANQPELFWYFKVPGNVLQISKRKYATEKEAKQYVLSDKFKVEGVPDAPFKKSKAWSLLAIKRMVRYAAENGFDKIAWTTGEQQVKRYEKALRKQVDKIEWTKTEEGIQLVGYKNGKQVVDTVEKEDAISDAIGKSMGDTIIASPEQTGVFEGDDITISDTGMAGFYDKILPSAVNKFFNKAAWGKAKVGETEIETQEQIKTEADGFLDAEYGKGITQEVWSLPITPEMKQKALYEGMPLFSVGARVGKTKEPLPEFHPDKIKHVGLKDAAESGIISTDEAAVIDGILQNFPEAYRAHFVPRFSKQKFAPTEAQLKAHGIKAETVDQVIKGVLLSEDVQGLKDETRSVAVMFAGSDITTFLHEFGEFAHKRLLTSAEKKYVAGVARKKAKGKAPNEFFSDEFRNFMVREVENKESLYPPKLTELFRKVADTVREIWERIRNIDPTPALDELFKDLLGVEREIQEESRPGSTQVAPKTRIRQVTGQALTPERLQARDDLKAALRMAARNARIAFREGNKEGLATEKARMRALIEKAKRRTTLRADAKKVRARLIKELKTSKAKKRKGKFGPEKQVILDKMRELTKLTQVQASKELFERFAKYTTTIPTIEESFENRVLAVLSMPLVEVRENNLKLWQDTLELIQTLKQTGRSEVKLKAVERALRIAEDVNTVVDIVGGINKEFIGTGKKVKNTDLEQKQRWRNAFFAGGFQLGAVQDWDNIMDILSFGDITSKPGQSALSKIADVFDAKKAEDEGGMIAMELTQQMYMDAYGLENKSQLVTEYEQDAIEENLGRFIDLLGRERDLKMTKAEARKRWATFADPSLHEVFFSGEAEKGEMGWTQEMVAALDNFLTDQDKDYAQRYIAFLGGYYKTIDPVYTELYGLNMPFNSAYTPISREGVSKIKDAIFGEMLQDAPFRGSNTPGAIKARVRNMHPIAQDSDTTVLARHIMEMEHFKAWAERVRDLNAIFGNPKVIRAIQDNWGEDTRLLEQINMHIQSFARGKLDASENYELLDKWRINFTQSVIPAKGSILVKQLTSTVAFADAIPVSDFVTGFAEGLSHPVKTVNEMYKNSTWLQARWKKSSINRDIESAMRTEEYKKTLIKPSFKNRLFLLVKVGDIAASFFGGYPVYKYHLKKNKAAGMSDAEAQKQAIDSFERVAESTQQSSALHKLSSWQKGSSLQKLFTMFANNPLQFNRKVISALRNKAAERITRKEFAKTFIIFHWVLPLFFQWVSDLFPWGEDEDDDEDFLGGVISKQTARIMIIGNFNNIFIFGSMTEWLLSETLGLYGGDIVDVPPVQLVKDLHRAISEFTQDDMTDEDLLEGIRALAGAAGGAAGLPLKTAVDFGTGFSDFISGEYEKGIGEMMGWSPHVAGKRFEEE